jgi:hypothetical protein
MNSCYKQKGGSYASWNRDKANEEFLKQWKENEEYYENERIRGIKEKLLEKLKNDPGGPQEFKEIMDELYNIPKSERFSGMKKKKPKKKKQPKKPKKKKATKQSNHSKKQDGGKSRKPKKAMQTRKRPKKAKQTRKRPKRSRLSHSSKLAGYNPYPFGAIGSYK